MVRLTSGQAYAIENKGLAVTIEHELNRVLARTRTPGSDCCFVSLSSTLFALGISN